MKDECLYVIIAKNVDGVYYIDHEYNFKDGLCDSVVWKYEDISETILDEESKKYHFTYSIEEL